MSDTDQISTGSEHAPSRGGRIRVLARIALALILVGGPAVAVWVAMDLLAVRGSLQEARTALGQTAGSLGDADVESAESAVGVAVAELADARRRSARFTWSIASAVPFLGPSIDVTRDVIDVAGHAVDTAEIVVGGGGQILSQGSDVVVTDGRIDLAPFDEAGQLLASLPVEGLAVARDALAAPRDAWIPAVVRDGRTETLGLADETLETIVRARALTDALPGFLGVDGPRRYFIGLQTSAELRGTGGLIGFWGVLSVDEGRVAFGDSDVSDPLDDDVSLPDDEARTQRVSGIGLSAANPPDADAAYLRRYATLAGARSFPNINLDPDLPTTSKAILDLYELQTGDRLDGVVLLDPSGLQRLLEASGSVLPLSDDLTAALGTEGGLPTEDFASFVTADIYETYGSDAKLERKNALLEIGDAAFAQVLAGGWDGAAMVGAVGEAASERHLQVSVTDAQVQSALGQVGATGALDLSEDSDRFAVTANNIVGGKQDVHLGHEFAFDIQLEDVRRSEDGTLSAARALTLDVTVDNPLPASGMDEYIIGSCYVPDAVDRCFLGEPGSNRTWFSLWAPPDTRVVDFASDDGTAPRVFSKTYRGLRVVDHLHSTSSQARAAFAYELQGRAPLIRESESIVYELSWWRQAKAVPDLLDVRVAAPDGWDIDRVEVIGGGDGRGSGVHGSGVVLEAAVVDGQAQLRGTVTADTRLLVHLVGAEQ